MRDYIMVIIRLNIFEEKINTLYLLHLLFNASYEKASNSASVGAPGRRNDLVLDSWMTKRLAGSDLLTMRIQ